MTNWVGNLTLSLRGEEWLSYLREFAEGLDTPEAAMLADRLEAGLSGEVEDRLTALVLAQVVQDLSDRLAQLEARR